MKIRYVAPFLDISGYAEASRNNIYALLETPDVELSLTSLYINPNNKRVHDEKVCKLLPLIDRFSGAEADVNIVHAVPCSNAKSNKTPNISCTVWEFEDLPKTWTNKNINHGNRSAMDSFQGIIVPTEFSKISFGKHHKNVTIIPHCFDFSEYNTKSKKDFRKQLIKDNLIQNEETFIFYSVFEFTERKNPYALFHAFLSEFSGNENVALIIKTYLYNYSPQNKDKLHAEFQRILNYSRLKNTPNILFLDDRMEKEDFVNLHKSCDCFVSSSRCEGFGLPLAEAFMAKKPVIAPRYSGYLDFCNDSNSFLCDYKLEPYHDEHNIHPLDFHNINMIWCDVDVMDLRKKMRYAYEHREECTEKGLKGYNKLNEMCNYKKVGKQIYDYANSIKELK